MFSSKCGTKNNNLRDKSLCSNICHAKVKNQKGCQGVCDGTNFNGDTPNGNICAWNKASDAYLKREKKAERARKAAAAKAEKARKKALKDSQKKKTKKSKKTNNTISDKEATDPIRNVGRLGISEPIPDSAVCENCGEIHELEDEYEFGAHDEYEEVEIVKGYFGGTTCKGPGHKKNPNKEARKKTPCVEMSDLERNAWLNNPNTNKKLKQQSKKGKAGGQGTYKVSDEDKWEEHPTAMRNKKNNIDKNQKGGTAKNTLTFSSSTYEPIPDYITRALQPKKSVHPEYGNLRY